MAKTFDGPPTLERSGSEHRRAVTSFPLMVKGKAWFRIKDPPAGEGQVGQSQTHLKDHLIDFFLLPFYSFTLFKPSCRFALFVFY